MFTILSMSLTVIDRSPTVITTAWLDPVLEEHAGQVKRKNKQRNEKIKYLIALVNIVSLKYIHIQSKVTVV